MTGKPAPGSDVSLMARPRQRNQYIRVQQKGSHLSLVLEEALHCIGAYFRGVLAKNYAVEAIFKA